MFHLGILCTALAVILRWTGNTLAIFGLGYGIYGQMITSVAYGFIFLSATLLFIAAIQSISSALMSLGGTPRRAYSSFN